MVRTTNKSCLNSIVVYEPGDPGHSMGKDCVRVGAFLCFPSSCVPAGFPNEEGREGAGV